MGGGETALGSALLERLQARQDETVMTFLHRKGGMQASPVTGGALLEAARKQAAVWRTAFGEGRFVLAVSMPHGAAFVTAVLAGLLEGITVLALPPSKPGDPRLPHIVKDSGARAIIALPEGRAALERCLTGVSVPIYAPDGRVLSVGTAPADAPLRPDTVLLQYTSGSTRMPKGVELSGANILANADLVARTWGLGRDSVVINWMPHFHDMGLMGCVLYPILFGGISVQMSPFDVIRKPVSWLEAVQTFGGTITGGPAFIFAECLKRITPEESAGLDLSSLKQAFCGAEPVPADVLPAFEARFASNGLRPGTVFACYGMAENALFVAGRQSEGPSSDTFADARPKALAPCHLTKETRDLIRIAANDEILVRGPSCTKGYLNVPDETANSFVADEGLVEGDRWLRTGDLGHIEGDALFITGRLKDMLIVHGRNVAATEVEWLAASVDAGLNRHAAAAFAPDPTQSGTAVLLIEWGEKAHSLPQAEALRGAISRSVKGTLGVHLSDIRILPRGTLDKTSSGKVRRACAAKSYHAGTLHPGLDQGQRTETT